MIRLRSLSGLKTVKIQANDTSLSKRIKRHITGREKDFFAATSPGLESICLDELKAFSSTGKAFMKTEGGVQFTGRVPDCCSANLNLRTANRILMRIGEFKATNFLLLEKKLSDFPWELYLPANSLPEIKTATKHSRLYHKDAISHIFTGSIMKRLAQNGTLAAQNSPITQQVFVRAVNDRFTISLDSSGELLYRRGIKTHSAMAPLRETIAAAVLKLCGYNGSEPLIDPMCGSGTFSLEGAMIAQNIPAGWFRDFAFMNWPCFSSKRWTYIKRKAESEIKKISVPLIFASDINSKSCEALVSCINKYDIFKIVEVLQKDFFDLSPLALKEKTGLVIINPPYGHRIGNKPESMKLFHSICDKLKKDFSGWKVGLIVPDIILLNSLPFILKAQSLYHGGLKIYLLYGRIR